METQYLKIPKERVAVLIGKKGEDKKRIETATKTEIEVDSKTGETSISLKKNGDDVMHLKAVSIVKAIGRGFSPEHALSLLADNVFLEIMNLTELLGKNMKAINQKKGRVIGKSGITRKKIEEETSTFISVYGKTIAVIGSIEGIETAKEAIEMLLRGTTHDKVYAFLKRKIKIHKGFEF